MSVEKKLVGRYSRQMLLPSVQRNGQESLRDSLVVVVGAGGLGSSCLMYLAGAGVGHIRIIDFDAVEEGNLHRQIIHSEVDASTRANKAESATRKLCGLNSSLVCEAVCARLTHSNAMELLRGAHVVIDATDNFSSRYLICDACFLLGVPLVSGSAVGLEGQLTVHWSPLSPCYRCIYPEPSFAEDCRSCSNAGVLGPVPGVIGCMQAVEAIKIIITARSHGEHHAAGGLKPLVGRQVFYDAMNGNATTFNLPEPDPLCKLCGDDPSIKSIGDSQGFFLFFVAISQVVDFPSFISQLTSRP